jgi:menaquinol-cytochrome c reductase iron-sulfur subunit
MQNNEPSNPGANRSRRSFMLLLPFAAIAGMFATVATAAFRFLGPLISAASQKWIHVATLAEINGDKPVARKIVAEQTAGWARSLEEHSVFILPTKNNQVLSARCPHEGCEVSWSDNERVFSCPCHDSNFAPDGSRISGPARRGLDALPSRVENGKLQIQYQFFASNTQERITRG